MKISCLIAAYQAGNYIGKALESIRAQDHTDWEVIVVEDGSRDQTERIVREFAASCRQSVRYDNYGVNKGVASARNRLFELATGEVCAFLDADDWWTARHLSNAARKVEDGADVVVSPIQLWDLAGQKNLEVYTPTPALFTQPVKTLFDLSAIMTSSCVALRTETVRRVGSFDPAFRIGEDRDYWIRCAAQGARFARTDETTCYYSKHLSSTMAKTLVWAQQEVAFYEKHLPFAAVPASLRRARLSHSLANYGRLLRATDSRASARALARAWKLRPFSLGLGIQLAASLLKRH